jgi:signal transduction histidine kinase
LTSIKSFSKILLQHPIDDAEAQRQFLQVIHDEAERLSHALNIVSSVEEHANPEQPDVRVKHESPLLELETPEV